MPKKVNKLKAILAALLAVAVMASVTVKIYDIREDSAGRLLWNADGAYLFISVAQRGVRVSYLGALWMTFKEYVGGVRLPDNERDSVSVIEVTPGRVEQHVVEIADTSPGSGPGEYTPFEGHIYANCPALGGLCRWSGDRFQPATEDERRRLDGINRLIVGDIDNENGWSKHGIGAGPVSPFARFAANVGGRFTISEKIEPVGRTGYVAVSIYLQRPEQAPERIWHLDGHPRRVSRGEYEQVFGRH